MKSNDTPNPQRAMPSLPAETFLMGTDCERAFLRLVCGAMLALGGAVVANAVTVCDVRAYGAKADGTAMNTNAIQAAVDACAKKGGGKVTLDGGIFLSGPVVMKSNFDLDIAKGTTLQGSSKHDDYPKKTEFRNPGLQSLVSAINVSNVSITGGGVIDGAGESWWKEARSQGDPRHYGPRHATAALDCL
jgi:hypothetical protein